MQVLDLEFGTIQLKPNQTVSVRTKKISENLRLIDSIFSFDLSFDLPAGQKFVFMNKRGMIEEINIFQDGKRILNHTSLPDLMELNCELFSEVSDLAHGSFFFARERTAALNSHFAKNGNVQGQIQSEIDNYNNYSTQQVDNFPSLYNVANTFQSKYNNTGAAIPTYYKKCTFSFYRYFMQTFIKNKMNSEFLFMPNLEIEIIFSPISSFAYQDADINSLAQDDLNLGQQSDIIVPMNLINAKMLIPMNQQMEMKEDSSVYLHGETDYYHQFENLSIKQQDNKILKKVYLQQKKNYINIVQNLYENYLLQYSDQQAGTLLKNPDIKLQRLLINGKKIFHDNIDMSDYHYYLFLTQNLKGTNDYKKNLLQTLMQTNVLAIDFSYNIYNPKMPQKIDLSFVQNTNYYMFVYTLQEGKVVQTKNGIMLF